MANSSKKMGREKSGVSSPSIPDHSTQALRLFEESGRVYFSVNLNPEVSVDYLSNTIQLFTGYDAEEIRLNPALIFDILQPGDLQPDLNSKFQESGDVDVIERQFRIRQKSGRTVWVTTQFRLNFHPDGTICSVEGIVSGTGIEPNLKARNYSLLGNLIDATIDAVILVDAELKVFVFNPAAENMFGCRREEAIGQPVQKFVSDPSILEGMAEKARQTEALQEEPPLSQPRVSQGIRCNGEEFPIEISLSAFITLDSLVFSAIIRDITDRKRVEDELRHLSTHDGLTGLYNRFYFQAEMDRLDKGREEIISVVIADMDGLKYVNDNYGHAAGDEMIKTVARAIQKAFRLGDVIARLGGDEFGVLLPGADSMTTSLAIHRIYENIRHSNEQRPYLQIGISIGYATTQEYESLAETIKRADAQMYYQKNRRTSPPRQ